MSSTDKDKCEFSCISTVVVFAAFASEFSTFNCRLYGIYGYIDRFVCLCLSFIFLAFVRKWWRGIIIAIGVFLYVLYLAIWIALAAIFAPPNGEIKIYVNEEGTSVPVWVCSCYDWEGNSVPK